MRLEKSHLRSAAISAALALASAALTPCASVAESPPLRVAVTQFARPLPQRQVLTPRQLPWRATPLGPHIFYGTIISVRGSIVTLRLRTGRIQTIDATTAITSGNYSAPLFVGKVVSVDGNEIGLRFVAAHIYRLTNLENLRADK